MPTTHARWWMLRTLGRHPLLRHSDRAEAAAVAVAAVLTITAIPLAVDAGTSMYHDELRVVQHEAQTRHSKLATATADSTAKTGYPSLATVPVQWSTGTGTRDAVITVDGPVKFADSVALWIDDAGDVTVPPRSETDARLAGVMIAVELWAVITSLGVVLAVLARGLLNRHRYRSWDREHRRLVH